MMHVNFESPRQTVSNECYENVSNIIREQDERNPSQQLQTCNQLFNQATPIAQDVLNVENMEDP